jgi:hypothetical protein
MFEKIILNSFFEMSLEHALNAMSEGRIDRKTDVINSICPGHIHGGA